MGPLGPLGARWQMRGVGVGVVRNPVGGVQGVGLGVFRGTWL